MKRTPLRRSGWARKPAKAAAPGDAVRPDQLDPCVVDGGAGRREAAARPAASISRVSAGPRAPAPKSTTVRSEAYRRAVATLPCVICGRPGPSQAAHGSAGKGMALKASDMDLFPACADQPGIRGCHSKLDQGALFGREERRALELQWAAETRATVERMGLWPANLVIPKG